MIITQAGGRRGALHKRIMPSYIPSASHIDLFRAYRANADIMRRITNYDSALVVYYDSAVARYGVARLTERGLRFLFLWQTDPGGEYLPLDGRLLEKIRSADLRPNVLKAPKSADEVARAADDADDARRAKAEKEFDDDVTHLTASNRRYLMKVFASAYNLP